MVEIATDKVDSYIPSPVAGKIIEVLFNEDDVVEVGKIIAILATEGEDVASSPAVAEKAEAPKAAAPVKAAPDEVPFTPERAAASAVSISSNADRFYSPLVKNIAKQESISVPELDTIAGTGSNGRVTKRDILGYVANRASAPVQTKAAAPVTPSNTGIYISKSIFANCDIIMF
jgi:2-oxoglutarate dehydrogenase E2 component (dihydrolipoamide succinyltransferase)